jgi:hypothetical protein
MLGDGVRACELIADSEEEIFELLRRFEKKSSQVRALVGES